MIDNAKSLLASGRWATAQFKKALLEGKNLTTEALRTLDTLRHEEWKFFDEAVIAEATRRMVGVGDLVANGLVRPVPNALGKLVFGYLTDHISKKTAVLLSYVTQIAGTLLLIGAQTPAAVYTFAALFGFGMGGAVPLQASAPPVMLARPSMCRTPRAGRTSRRRSSRTQRKPTPLGAQSHL